MMAHALRVARKKAKISQRELAKRMGVAQPRVAAIERATDLNLSTFRRYVEGIGGRTRVEILVGDTRVSVLGD